MPEGSFSIRFEVGDGKGILRVARPGVLIDPPARPTGLEERLTSAQLRASRFLHVWDGGRGRQGHSLTRLEDSAMDRLPVDVWVPLVPSGDGGLHYLFLPDIAPEIETEVVDDEPTSPTRILTNLREDLSTSPVIEAIEAGSATDEVPIETSPAGAEVARMFSVAHEPPPGAEPVAAAASPAETDRAASAFAERQTDGSVGGPRMRIEPAPDDDNLVPATPLVRHLHRQVARQNARILELEEEVRHLRTRRPVAEG